MIKHSNMTDKTSVIKPTNRTESKKKCCFFSLFKEKKP